MPPPTTGEHWMEGLHVCLFVIHLGYLIKIMKALNMFDFFQDWILLTKGKEEKNNEVWETYWNLLPRRLLIRSSPSFISSRVIQHIKQTQRQCIASHEKIRVQSQQDLCFHSDLVGVVSGMTRQEKREKLAAYLHERGIEKMILSSPGGLRLSYMMGSVVFIKQNCNLSSFIFSGASAGAWCSLFLCYRHDLQSLLMKIFADLLPVRRQFTIFEEMMRMKDIILKHSSTDDYDLERLFVGVLRFDYLGYQTITTIHCHFQDLEDAINCCVASSNIPFVTGKWNQTYQNEIVWDGGFSNYPYLNLFSPSLVLSPHLWKQQTIEQFTSMFSFQSLDFLANFWQGYNDAMIHRSVLSSFLASSS